MIMPRSFHRVVLGLAIVVATTLSAAFARAGEGDEDLELALEGYCPAAYLLTGEATKGDLAHQMAYRGRLYHFLSAEAKEKFQADPEKLHPQFAGLCLTALGGSYGNRLPGVPTVFEIVDGKVYLFSSERARRAYHDIGLQTYIPAARTRWAQPALDGYCPVSFQTENEAVKGDPKFRSVFRAAVYHLASAEAKTAFEKDAEKYLPKYEGFCAEGVTRDKRYPGDPPVFTVVDGKTYLFFDESAKSAFSEDLAGNIKKADAKWVTLKDKDKR